MRLSRSIVALSSERPPEACPSARGVAARLLVATLLVACIIPPLGLWGSSHRFTREVQSVTADTTPTPVEYFGLHIHRAVALRPGEPLSAWPDAPFGSWRLWDARVAWADLEPTRGHWDFARLDSCVELARRHNVRVLLTLGLTPRWASSRPDEKSNYGLGNQAPPADTLDWSRYVDTLVKRYRGRIEAYEIWNEPNLHGFYSGTPQELAQLGAIAYAIIKRVDAQAVVVTPSATGVPGGAKWLRDYLAAGGGNHADVVGFHFYVTPAHPEAMVPAIATVREVLRTTGHAKLPLWNTESGWLMQNTDVRVEPSGAAGTFGSRVLDLDTSAAFVVRALVLGRCGGLSRFYWYAWDNRRMGLVDTDGRTRKPAAAAYAAVLRWMIGGRVDGCERRADGAWIVRIRRADGSRAMIAWSTGGTRTVDPPGGAWVNATESMLGTRRRHKARRRAPVKVTAFPILIDLA